MKNQHAVALGRRNKGKKKQMTPEAMNQRREASIRSAQARKSDKSLSQDSDSEPITNNRISTENKA